jgi:hypothetical protein
MWRLVYIVLLRWGETMSLWNWASNGPFVHSPRQYMSEYRQQWNIDREKSNESEKTCPSATLSITNPTWTDLGTNPGLHGQKPATNSLSYDPAYVV